MIRASGLSQTCSYPVWVCGCCGLCCCSTTRPELDRFHCRRCLSLQHAQSLSLVWWSWKSHFTERQTFNWIHLKVRYDFYYLSPCANKDTEPVFLGRGRLWMVMWRTTICVGGGSCPETTLHSPLIQLLKWYETNISIWRWTWLKPDTHTLIGCM